MKSTQVDPMIKFTRLVGAIGKINIPNPQKNNLSFFSISRSRPPSTLSLHLSGIAMQFNYTLFVAISRGRGHAPDSQVVPAGGYVF